MKIISIKFNGILYPDILTRLKKILLPKITRKVKKHLTLSNNKTKLIQNSEFNEVFLQICNFKYTYFCQNLLHIQIV
jgi:hypothetical protein